ncbi:hypothetical protein X975_22612, partial [Stegodyphus mimosarum]
MVKFSIHQKVQLRFWGIYRAASIHQYLILFMKWISLHYTN